MDNSKQTIIVETIIKAPVSNVWKSWTSPDDIVNWNFASDDWHSPEAENDLRTGGTFRWKMAAKDGSMSFDFEGKYTAIALHNRLNM